MSVSALVPPSRPKRADARRNYDRLIAAATEAFEKDGPEASLDGIAKAAGVGAGTLYRHFPHRRALLEAVYAEQIVELCELGAELAASDQDAESALATWLRKVVAHTLGYRGLKEVLTGAEAADGPSDFSWCAGRMRETCGTLLQRAQATGAVTTDLDGTDLLRLTHGVVLSCDYLPEPERSLSTDRAFAVLRRGLRP